MLFLPLREKLTEVHEELQKKQELIEDLQPDINQNGRYLWKLGSDNSISKDLPFFTEGCKVYVYIFAQCVDTYIVNKDYDNF